MMTENQTQQTVTLVDSHCHLDYDYEGKDTAQLISDAKSAGVRWLVTIATESGNLEKVREISEKHPSVFHTVGIHPHEASEVDDQLLLRMEKMATHPRCRAIGEIGLDYYYDHSPRDIQIEAFEKQLEVALKTSQPVVIHTRDAEKDTFDLLNRYVKRCKLTIPGAIHCFTGTTDFGKQCIDLGFFISFSGIVTFKKSRELQDSAKAFPLQKLMVETDSPFLAPEPKRGRKCEPSMVRHTAEKLAELRQTSLEEIARVTTANAVAFFRIDD